MTYINFKCSSTRDSDTSPSPNSPTSLLGQKKLPILTVSIVCLNQVCLSIQTGKDCSTYGNTSTITSYINIYVTLKGEIYIKEALRMNAYYQYMPYFMLLV